MTMTGNPKSALSLLAYSAGTARRDSLASRGFSGLVAQRGPGGLYKCSWSVPDFSLWSGGSVSRLLLPCFM